MPQDIRLRLAAISAQVHHLQLQYRGRCKYKSGKCTNERSTKDNGLPHTLCEPHRLQHNKNQRKSDVKRRRQKRLDRSKKSKEPTVARRAVTSKKATSGRRGQIQTKVATADESSIGHDDAAITPTPIGLVKWNDEGWTFEDMCILREIIIS
ncbi:hypothetical protein DYB36_010584 [Aphanomyces astaci]|uniref:Uncharacterized protein n=1 Tax=Aphanomyces astaci TaxID=112090 RepID=A0A397BLJ1_APHAT|nr:hypothetical protein DYB36_010584 [Aphanomyces astaci]